MRFLALVLFCILLPGLLAGQKEDQQKSGAKSDFRIAGMVVDAANNEPLAHARVSISPVSQRDASRFMIAGENGRFLFDHVSPGKYMLVAHRQGYLGQAYNEHDGFSTAIAVGPGLDPGELVFRLHPDCSISGTITDEHAEPVRYAEVTLFQDRQPEISAIALRIRASTDDEGNFRFAHLTPGKYFLAVVAQPWYRPFVNVDAILETEIRRHMAAAIYVAAGDQATPAQGQAVSAEDPATKPHEASPLDVLYPVAYYPAGTDAAGAAPIVLVSGDRFVADISLQPVPALHVTLPVSGNSSQPLALAVTQRIFNEAVSVPFSNHVSQGSVDIRGLASGRYEISIGPMREEDAQPPPKPPIEVDLSPNGEVQTLPGPAVAQVKGSAKLDDGTTPGEGIVLRLRNRKTGEIIFAGISEKGEFIFSDGVPPGSYDVTVSGPEDLLLQAVAATSAKATGTLLEIGDAPEVTLALTLTRGSGQVNGIALKEEKGFPGAMIVLVPQDAAHNLTLFHRDQSDSDGTFTLDRVLPGNYTVLALENAWDLQWSNPKVLRPYMAGGMSVQVRSGEKLQIKANVQVAGPVR